MQTNHLHSEILNAWLSLTGLLSSYVTSAAFDMNRSNVFTHLSNVTRIHIPVYLLPVVISTCSIQYSMTEAMHRCSKLWAKIFF